MLVINQDIREWYSKWVLRTQTVKSYQQIAVGGGMQDRQALRYCDAKVAIDFARHHLTHLDPVVFRDENVPLELFVDYDHWIKNMARETKKMRRDHELCEEQDLPGIEANTYYCHPQAPNTALDVRVVDFDPAQGRFLVRNEEEQVVAWRSRLYLQTGDDRIEDLLAARKKAAQLKAEGLHYLRV
jgi:hypothetical protein